MNNKTISVWIIIAATLWIGCGSTTRTTVERRRVSEKPTTTHTINRQSVRYDVGVSTPEVEVQTGNEISVGNGSVDIDIEQDKEPQISEPKKDKDIDNIEMFKD